MNEIKVNDEVCSRTSKNPQKMVVNNITINENQETIASCSWEDKNGDTKTKDYNVNALKKFGTDGGLGNILFG